MLNNIEGSTMLAQEDVPRLRYSATAALLPHPASRRHTRDSWLIGDAAAGRLAIQQALVLQGTCQLA